MSGHQWAYEAALARNPAAVRALIIDSQVHAHVSITVAAERYEQACADPAAHVALLHINHARYSGNWGPVGWGVTAEQPPLAVKPRDLLGVAA